MTAGGPIATRADDRPRADVPAGVPIDPSELVGSWNNTDRGRSGGVHRLVVGEASNPGELVVRGFGCGDPDPHDWGEVRTPALAYNVDGGLGFGFTCGFDFGFETTEVAAYGKEGILIIVTYNSFSDGSGRADYWTREFFSREASG